MARFPMIRDCTVSEFLRVVKRTPSPLVHHNVKYLTWVLKTNKCVWICRLGCDTPSVIIDKELELKIAKVQNVTFHHY